ncbi:MAG: bifunctional indole-3-glycerol-phosphate synthase TrpC/phosphoribosylanthranilate isomerase TrpF [Gemmatimonadota bacterium]
MALDRILATKRREVAVREDLRPLPDLERQVVPSDRDFVAALRGPAPAFILEVKRASPSEGSIRAGDDVEQVLEAYRPFASAISVLTDETYFRGSFDTLARVRATVTQPVLCKDFLLGPYQVVEARSHGADAVLLMLSVLDDATYRRTADAARRLRMGVLTEAHTAEEVGRALALGAPVIGINNRDLGTLAVDLEVTKRLAPLVPPDRLVVSESGLGDYESVRAMAPAVDGFLVGTALMRSPDIGHATRSLIFGPTKVCGLTRPEDAEAAHRLGATHGGLIFVAASPRAVTERAARAVRSAAPLRWVGVFVDAPPEDAAAVATRLALGAVQLHGDETADYVRDIRRRLPSSCEVWKAVQVRGPIPRPEDFGVDRILLDAPSDEQRGGTGRPFDWTRLPTGLDRSRYVLSGGLSPANAEAAGALGIQFLDVNSGVEAAPGIKDREKLDAFFTIRRGRRRARTQ